MTLEDISKYLSQYSIGGDTVLSDIRSARSQLGALRQLYDGVGDDGITSDQYNMISAGLKNQIGAGIGTSAIAGINGLTQIAAGYDQVARINDTDMYQRQIGDYLDSSNYNFTNYSQLANDYAYNPVSTLPTESDIRGMSNGQKIGSVATAGLAGASAGMTIGGPIGAAIGGALGAGIGYLGVRKGDKEAEYAVNNLKTQRENAEYGRMYNYQAAHERIGDYNFRKGVVNAAKEGGQMNRKQTITQYADRVLGTSRPKEHKASSVKRMNVDGGVQFRFRVK